MDIPTAIPKQDQVLIQNLLEDKPPEFTDLTQTQYEAFNQGVLDGDNHVVVAHTGNGKTLCAEALTRKSLKNNENVAYLVPSTSLVNDKHKTIKSWTDDTVEVRKRGGYKTANVIVATFESFYEAVIRGYSDRFDTVILDDMHEIYDESHRGPTIEKGIAAALNQNCRILAVSATLGNPEIIADWMDAGLTVSTEDRAVPIEERPVEKTNDSYAAQIGNIIEDNPEKGPFIIFCDTTRNVESRALGIADKMTFETPNSINFEQRVKENVKTSLTDTHKDLISALENGVGYHHSQMESALKDEIANLAEKGIIKCVTATTSLSYGFNSPVQSVITADLRRYTREHGQTFIGQYEYVQMIGRAGRDADVYDQAYAFPMYDDEDAPDEFGFDNDLEEKEIEAVHTHLNGREQLRWLILELINYGWETSQEVFEFISNTLYWQEAQRVKDMDETPDDTPDIISKKIKSQLDWLEDNQLVYQQEGIGNDALTNYNATDMGSAVVEFHHSNWFGNTVTEVHQLAKWLRTEIENETVTPEQLTQRLAQKYYHCNHNMNIQDEEVIATMNQYGLFDDSGHTAGVVCWFWCQGFSLDQTKDATQTTDLTRLPSTAHNVATAVDSLSHLFSASTMPSEPKWLSVFETQLSTGVSGIDTYLLNSTPNFGRTRYNELVQQMDTISSRIDADPGEDYYLIERLKNIYHEKTKDVFLSIVKNANEVGTKTGLNLYETIKDWNPDEYDPISVPFEYLTRTHDESQFDESTHSNEDGEGLVPEDTADQNQQSSANTTAADPDANDGATNSSLSEYL